MKGTLRQLMEEINPGEVTSLPGFRFHPTEEELLDYYLKMNTFVERLHCDIIGYLDIYRHDPWELPGLAKIGEREWYFYVPKERKNGHGGRSSRRTENGYWKATGSDRTIKSLKEPQMELGYKKTLVFYEGKAPRGRKTDWVMNEYRLPPGCSFNKEDMVLCKVYRKATSLKVIEQRAGLPLSLEGLVQPKEEGEKQLSPVINIEQECFHLLCLQLCVPSIIFFCHSFNFCWVLFSLGGYWVG